MPMGFRDEVREREAKIAARGPVLSQEERAAEQERQNREAFDELVAEFLVAAKERGVHPRNTMHPRKHVPTGIRGWNLTNNFSSYLISEEGQAFMLDPYGEIVFVRSIPMHLKAFSDDFFLKDELMNVLFR